MGEIPIQGRSIELMSSLCSRNSGLRATSPTFGVSNRFPPSSLASTPGGASYYSHCTIPTPGAAAPATSLGYGERWERLSPFIHVGPQSYSPVTSHYKHRSSLDGPEFCSVTLKSRPVTSLDRSRSGSPGPAAYNIKREISGPRWVLGARLPDVAEVHRLKEAARGGALVDATCGLPERPGSRKGTFGTGHRFPRTLYQPHSPSGEVYYAHNRSTDSCVKRSTSLGYGKKTEFEKLTEKTPGPLASYYVVTSVFKSTSPMDGFRTLYK
jgi:hypothetical protein